MRPNGTSEPVGFKHGHLLRAATAGDEVLKKREAIIGYLEAAAQESILVPAA